MTYILPGGYAGKVLRVDLTRGQFAEERWDEATLRKYLGGTGIGIKLLYEEVPPGIEWSDPENRIIFASGPLSGTKVGGSGMFSAVTKGCLTNGATSTQANGFFGAYLKFSGFDTIIVQGIAPKMIYLYLHDDTVELRDASHLAGKDTWETERLIKEELGKKERELSVFSIGPAGEKLVKFACLVGDKGHVASKNGIGAVMGSKKLKAIAAARGKAHVAVKDREGLSTLAEEMFQKVIGAPGFFIYEWGTFADDARAEARLRAGILPIKNYTTNIFPQGTKLSAESARPQFEIKRHPCWACKFHHCHLMKITEGPYAGYTGEEPEYEQWAAWTSLIGQSDLRAAMMLSNEVDRLGMDANESGWVIAWLMECSEKGILGTKDTDGLEMKWGDVEAVRRMLYKIAKRQGFGDILAEGIMRAAQYIGGEAPALAIHTKKGNTPRMHDHRSLWPMLLDTCVSDTSTDEDSPTAARLPVKRGDRGSPPETNLFTPEGAATMVGRIRGRMPLDDCLTMCRFNNLGIPMEDIAGLLTAATGWDFTGDEARQVGLRVVNLLRAYNIRHGHTRDLDAPSPRYGSTPLDGPHAGKASAPVWEETLNRYYELMGWDISTAKPLPKTLRELGLEHTILDIW